MKNTIKTVLALNILAGGIGLYFALKKTDEVDETKESLAQAKTEALLATTNEEKTKSELQTAKASSMTKDDTIRNLTAHASALRGEVEQAKQQLSQSNTKNQSTKAELARLSLATKKMQEIANQVAPLKSAVSQYESIGTPQDIRIKLNRLTRLETPAPVKPKPPAVALGGKVGKIANVDAKYGFLLLNRGSAHGLKIGDKFNVFRDNRLIGRVKVSRLSPNNPGISIAQRTEGLGVPERAQFQINDDLIKFQ
jgi:myosin heavy subunit